MSKPLDVIFVGRVNSIGCVTIPQEVRERFGIKKGTAVKVKLVEMLE